MLSDLYNEHVPIKTIKRKVVKNHWYNAEVEKAAYFRDYYHKIWIKSRTEDNWKMFTYWRNKATKIRRKAKMAYSYSRLNPDLPEKKLFSNLRQEGIIYSEEADYGAIGPDEFNQYFQSTQKVQSNCPKKSSGNVNCLQFSFRNISINECYRSLCRIKSEAVGADGVSLKFIRIIAPAIMPPLAFIFNTCLTKSVFPSDWKTSQIIPIPKNSNCSAVLDYRPISILSPLSKALEHVMKLQINQFVISNGLLHVSQSGFRNNHSTSTALLKVSYDVKSAMDNNLLTVLTLLDFSKAFDTVSHNLLYNKLVSNFRFARSAADLIFNYLADRSQLVKLNNIRSDTVPVLSGVPQGSILGPLLFTLFINDLPSTLKFCNVHMYADDVQLYRHFKLMDANASIGQLNGDLSRVSDWARMNQLTLNKEKTQVIVIYKRPIDTSLFPSVCISDTMLPYLNKVKNLGIIFNKSFTWIDHLNKTSQSVHLILRRLWKFATLTPLGTRRKLIVSLIIPKLLYGYLLFFPLDTACNTKLTLIYNSCLRYIYRLRKYDHISEYQNSIFGCSLANYLQFRSCAFLYKLQRSGQPSYLADQLIPGFSSRTMNFALPRHSSRQFSMSFFVHGITLWNALPVSAKRATSVGTFRSASGYFR